VWVTPCEAFKRPFLTKTKMKISSDLFHKFLCFFLQCSVQGFDSSAVILNSICSVLNESLLGKIEWKNYIFISWSGYQSQPDLLNI
jgi:hypothetical protein